MLSVFLLVVSIHHARKIQKRDSSGIQSLFAVCVFYSQLPYTLFIKIIYNKTASATKTTNKTKKTTTTKNSYNNKTNYNNKIKSVNQLPEKNQLYYPKKILRREKLFHKINFLLLFYSRVHITQTIIVCQ
jgi:hypothetical protein